MENIDSIVELSHVGVQENPNDDTGTFYIHGNYDRPGSKVDMVLLQFKLTNQIACPTQANDMLELMQSFASSNDIIIENSSLSRLPPASAQSFLRHNPSISTIIIGDYNDQFNDM